MSIVWGCLSQCSPRTAMLPVRYGEWDRTHFAGSLDVVSIHTPDQVKRVGPNQLNAFAVLSPVGVCVWVLGYFDA